MTVPTLRYESGTLTLEPLPLGAQAWQDLLVFDDRSESARALGMHYRTLLERLKAIGIAVKDEARAFLELPLHSSRKMTPYSHQSEALEAWKRSGRRGVVVLPTGAGKTLVAEMALEATPRSTLIVVPTLDFVVIHISPRFTSYQHYQAHYPIYQSSVLLEGYNSREVALWRYMEEIPNPKSTGAAW